MVKYKESNKWNSLYLKYGADISSDHEELEDTVPEEPSLIQNSNLFSHLLDLER